MVQGLAFLSKKSWHTKNLANQEKVWMAEQRKAAEESKTKELAKQIQQEREEEELDKIAGRKNVKRDRGIDWMYQGGTGAAAEEEELRKNEEYLMGKEFQPEGKAGGDFADLEQGGVNDVVASKPAAKEQQEEVPAVATAAAAPVNAEPSVADRNEAFRMRHEDPMFLVSQTRREQQNQQDKKRALYERVVGPTEDTKLGGDEERRRSKKERKRERKHRRREEEGRRRDRHHRKRRKRSRSRSRSSSRDRGHNRHHRRRHRSRSPSEDRRRSRSPERYYSDEDHRYDSRRRDRSRSRSHERERRRYRSRSPSPRDYRRRDSQRREYEYGGRDRYEGRAYGDRQPSSPHYHAEDRRREPERPRVEGFGLQGGKAAASRHDDLGPNRQLLDRKRQERDSERRRIRESASTRRRMTEEERAAALQAMERDASKRDALLNRAVAAKSRHNEDDEHAAPSAGRASFLQDMAEQTHGIRDSGSLATRVAQNRHTNQKPSDDFM